MTHLMFCFRIWNICEKAEKYRIHGFTISKILNFVLIADSCTILDDVSVSEVSKDLAIILNKNHC